MYLHYSDPHTPYSPPKKEDRWREFATEAGLSVESPPIHPPLEGVTLSPAQVDAMVARYDAEIAYFDKYFGELMRYMEETGFYSESLIILTSDHGEEFLDHDEFGHGNSLYNELLRVPLIVKYPDSMGMPGATTVDRFVALVDIASTIEDVLDARWNVTEWQGRSLLAGADSRSIYADNDAPALRTLYSRSNKLIQHLDLQGQVVGESFFAMDSDFDEKGDGIIPSGIQPIELDAMRAIMVDVFAGAESTLVDLDEETLGELKALGYLD
jgi:arylsulfatase A-like enzyme